MMPTDAFSCDIILLIGPSSIGKSTIIKQLSRYQKKLLGVSLDSLVRQYAIARCLIRPEQTLKDIMLLLGKRNQLFFEFGMQALHSFLRSQQHQTIIVDVGAGFLDVDFAFQWIENTPSIALTADIEFAYQRYFSHRRKDFSQNKFQKMQFSPLRMRAYDAAWFKLDCTNMDKHSITNKVIETALLLGQNCYKKSSMKG